MEKKRKRKTYSTEFKYKAVMMYKKGRMGHKTIARLLEVPSHTMIMRWERNFELYGADGLEERRGKKSKGRPKKQQISPEDELKKLRAEVELLKKIRALQRG